jgi:hypothetical protein
MTFAVAIRGMFWRPFLRAEVAVDQAKAVFLSLGPFEVIDEGPLNIPARVHPR